MAESLLYLAPLDPTVGSSGSAVRARLTLRFLADRYAVHLVHLEGRHDGGRDEALAGRLASRAAVPYSAGGYFLGSPALYRAAARVLERHEVGCVFAEFEKAGAYAALLERRYGVPFVYASHNVEWRRSLNLARNAPARLGLVPLLYVAERLACRRARAVFAVSHADALRLDRWTGGRAAAVTPVAFDETVFHPHAESQDLDPPVVLLVGNYRYAASREAARFTLGQVVPAVLARHPRAIFRFVGPGLQGVDAANVEVPGFVPDLVAEYRRATLVIAPILMGGGIRIKVVEALATGRFLVATPEAMAGLETGGLAHLEVVPREGFADAVARRLDHPPGTSQVNWEVLSRRYAAGPGLRRMEESVRDVLAARSSPCEGVAARPANAVTEPSRQGLPGA